VTHPAVIAVADALAVYRGLRLGFPHSTIAILTDKTVDEVHEWSDIFGTGPENFERPGRPLNLPARSNRGGGHHHNRITLPRFGGNGR
jgi:hypothetical protein